MCLFVWRQTQTGRQVRSLRCGGWSVRLLHNKEKNRKKKTGFIGVLDCSRALWKTHKEWLDSPQTVKQVQDAYAGFTHSHSEGVHALSWWARLGPPATQNREADWDTKGLQSHCSHVKAAADAGCPDAQ